jgi:hypothetical protein
MTQVLDGAAREGIRNILRNSVVEITFTKADGSSRVMKCTLSEEFLPTVEKNHDENATKRAVNPDVCPVWDMENQAWRSFRWDSITGIAL